MGIRETLKFQDLSTLGAEIKEIQAGGSIGIITDQTVAEHYLDACAESLRDQGYTLSYYIIPPGEESKNGDVYLEILNSIAKDGLTRTDGVVALGGGVIGDLAGFVAATYLRGIKVYQVPTTLLAMVDSSIGGKTGIDLQAGKNLAGAFHMPSLILQDQKLLATLPEEELLSGMAEVIKCAILVGGDFFEKIYSPDEDIPLDEFIRASCDCKIELVERDEFDTGDRQLLNLGHTIGHAIEKASDYDIKHGFAVAKGMAIMADISQKKGWCSAETARKILDALINWGYDLDIEYSWDELTEIIKLDKKRKSDVIDIVVPVEIGDCRLKRIGVDELGDLW